jgi:hypothetical protein
LSDVSKPKKPVVTTDDSSASIGTLTIFGAHVLSFGSCAALALKSARALAKRLCLGAVLLK